MAPIMSKLEFAARQFVRRQLVAHSYGGVLIARCKHTFSFSDIKWRNEIHSTSAAKYPETNELPLPSNCEDIADSEKARFSPERNRDIAGSLASISDVASKTRGALGRDPREASYDCHGAVSLNSSMQSNVPEPFTTEETLTNLNMPGGQWGQGHKYMAEDLNKSHPLNMASWQTSGGISDVRQKNKDNFTTLSTDTIGIIQFRRYLATAPGQTTSRKEQLKKAFKEYGATVIVFHVAISLVSLGGFYLAVTSGIDFSSLLGKFGNSEGAATAATAAPFVVAYAIHKVFAPVRISITLAATPFIVRHLRKIGFLKPPQPKA